MLRPFTILLLSVSLLGLLFFFAELKASAFEHWQDPPDENFYQRDSTVEHSGKTIANRYQSDGKQRGVHLFSRSQNNQSSIDQLLRTNTEWITFVPFGWMEDFDSPNVGHGDRDYSEWSRRDSFLYEKILDYQKAGFYIMVKPHIWIGHPSPGKWRSDIAHPSESDWQSWSVSYQRFILHYAAISEQAGVQQFCIGTELHQTVKDYPEFWRSLITKVRKIYSGAITYAANWNEEVKDVTFWDQLDYIGIQAYYPLTDKTSPSIRKLTRGWKKHLKEIESLHQRYQKPVLFTEVGYKSSTDAAIQPWTWPDNFEFPEEEVCYKTQANCYEAVFRTFWDKEWFAGVHFWDWHIARERQPDDQRRYDQRKNINFTPQDKPAAHIMTKWFARLAKP